jgi:RNA polymerase sigma factor (sigma-70 family)
MASIAYLRSRMLGEGDNHDRVAEGFLSDDETAYEELIAPIESRMMRCIWRVVRSPDLAEDALQDALTLIWRKLHQIRNHPNPHALILKICLNAACDALRKRKRAASHEDLSLIHNLPDSSSADAVRSLEAKEIEAEVLNAISQLPRKQALAVLMRIVQDEPFAVIAQTLGCSEVTVRIQVSKGRGRLRRLLSRLWTDS